MENPLDTSTSAGETLAQQIASLQRRVEGLERTRTNIPYFVFKSTEELIKFTETFKVPPGTLVIIKFSTNKPQLSVFCAADGLHKEGWYTVEFPVTP